MTRTNSSAYALLDSADGGVRSNGTNEDAAHLDGKDRGTSAASAASKGAGVGAFFETLDNCVEEDLCQKFMGLMVVLSVVALCGEIDAPEIQVWLALEVLCLSAFALELSLKLRRYTFDEYFFGKDQAWACLELGIVVIGVLDLCFTLVCACAGGGGQAAGDGEVGQRGNSSSLVDTKEPGYAPAVSLVCAISVKVRLTRLLRLLRVLKMAPQLMAFVVALRDVLATFIWLFVVSLMMLLTFAIVLTHLFHKDEVLTSGGATNSTDRSAEFAPDFFIDVPTSVFTLFQLMTIDNWEDIAKPLVQLNMCWRFFFVFFIATASWSMISVLTAVASNKMISATATRKEAQAREQERKYQAFIDFLHDSFMHADVDGNGVLDREEFNTMIAQDFVHVRMKELGVHLSRQDLLHAWEMLDIDESGELTIDEFVTGLSTLQEGLATKHVVSLDYSMKKVTLKSERMIDQICTSTQALARESAEVHGRLLEQSFDPPQDLAEEFSMWAASSAFGQWLKQQEINRKESGNAIDAAKS